MEQKPWIEGSLEVLELAIEQYYMSQSCTVGKEQRYLRLALINADDSVELSMKAFIQYHLHRRIPETFNKMINLIRDLGPSCQVILPEDLEGTLQFYHNQRSTLYHEGFVLSVPQAKVFNYIFCVSNLFRILFKNEVETNIQYDLRRQYLFQYLELERILRDLCTKNRMDYGRLTGIQPILDLLGKKENIPKDIEYNLGKAIELQNMLIPKTSEVQIEQDLDEGLNILNATLSALAELLTKSKANSGNLEGN